MYKNLVFAQKLLFAKQIQSNFPVSQRVFQNFLSQNANAGLGRCAMSIMAKPPSGDLEPEPPSTRIEPIREPTNDIRSYEPIDIDPWADAEDDVTKDGDSKEPKDIGAEFDFGGREYPPIPEHREGEYRFKGIKVKLPAKYLVDGTYRYRLDKDDEGLADDIRVIRFERS